MDIEELDKKVEKLNEKLNTRIEVQAVNTKWMIVVGLIIIAFLGYTSFISVPAEAKKAAKTAAKDAVEKEVGPQVRKDLKNYVATAKTASKELSDMEKAWKAKDLVKEVSEVKKIAQNKKMICRAIPREERKKYGRCAKNEFKLAEWCSGDCSGDDAKVTICCRDR